MLTDPLNWVQTSIQIKFPGCVGYNFTQFWILLSACAGEREQGTETNVVSERKVVEAIETTSRKVRDIYTTSDALRGL